MANEFYTLASLGTFAGATGATVVVTNTLKSAFGISPAWLGLVVSELICLGVLATLKVDNSSDWLVAVLNGCAVYTAAAGATSAVAAAGDVPGKVNAGTERDNASIQAGKPPVKPKTRFWSPWF